MIRMSSIRWVPVSTDPPMVVIRWSLSKARPEVTTRISGGLIPLTRAISCTAAIKGHRSVSMVVRPGARGTTRKRLRSIKIATDNRYPYWIYGSKQDSGTFAIASRGSVGEITDLDWFPLPGWESGFVTVDPAHPDVLFTNGPWGFLQKVNRKTWGAQSVDFGVGAISRGQRYGFSTRSFRSHRFFTAEPERAVLRHPERLGEPGRW